MNIVSVVGIAILGCVSALILKKFNASMDMLIILMCSVVICVFAVNRLGTAVDFLREINTNCGDNGYLPVMLKGLSVSFLCECAVDICRDCGQNSIASKVEFAGKVEILLLSIPLLRSVIELTKDLVST